MMDQALPQATSPTDLQAERELRRHRQKILSIHPPVPVPEGEVVPAVLTIDVGDTIHVAAPLGAFAMVQGKPRFVPTVDLVGLAAASLGIGVGALAVWQAPRIIRAIGEAEARRRGH